MTSLPDLDTLFRRRAHNLISPLAERFDPAIWNEAFAAVGETTLDDQRLLDGTVWIGARAQALYASRPVRFPGLSAADATVIAIAALNREYKVLAVNARDALIAASADGPMAVDYMSNIRFENAYGQSMSRGDFVETIVDALDAWLYDAARCPVADDGGATQDQIEIDPLPFITFYSRRHILKRLHDKSLHQGVYRNNEGVWVPHDRGLATLHHAWLARASAMFDSTPAQLLYLWAKMERTDRYRFGLTHSVKEARRSAQGFQLKIKRLTYLGNRAPIQPMIRAGLLSSYLSEFYDLPMPLFPDLSAARIEDCWWVCLDAARALAVASMPNANGSKPAEEWAYAIERTELIRAIAAALAVTPAIAEQLVGFLTYSSAPKRKKGEAARDSDHGWRGLWAAPLVPVPGTGRLLLPLPVLKYSAPLFRVEAWLEKGGLNDQGLDKASRGKAQRGNRFERSYRARLHKAMQGNNLLPKSHVAPDEIKKQDIPGGFPEQIDILFKLGSRLFVGELKFFLTPADPHQWSRYYEKLIDAARQAQKKAQALAGRRDIAAAALGLTEAEVERLPVTPLVILNNGHGFSLEVEGCRVVDANYLESFIASPYLSSGGVMGKKTMLTEEVTVLYSSEQDAARRFDQSMARPGILTRFVRRIIWDTITHPTCDDVDLRIASPFRGDMTPGERERRMEMIPPEYR